MMTMFVQKLFPNKGAVSFWGITMPGSVYTNSRLTEAYRVNKKSQEAKGDRTAEQVDTSITLP